LFELALNDCQDAWQWILRSYCLDNEGNELTDGDCSLTEASTEELSKTAMKGKNPYAVGYN